MNPLEHGRLIEEANAAINVRNELSVPVPEKTENYYEELPYEPENTGYNDKTDSASAISEVNLSGIKMEILTDSAEQIIGRKIRGEIESIDSAVKNLDRFVVICADIFDVAESRTTRNGKIIYTYYITDYTGSIIMKFFFDPQKGEFPEGRLKKGTTIIASGKIEYDDFSKDITIKPNSVVVVKKEQRMDHSDKKRVELHMHTSMSAMDAVTDVSDLIKRAHSWGHKAIAITDHGVVQAYPDAMNASAGLDDFKVIYGC